MKTNTGLAVIALIVAATMDSAVGMKSYLEELPNGSLFQQALGHPGDDSSKLTDFATAFSGVSHTWTEAFCKETFPGASMTNGAAFGDPCCTWKKGGTPDFTVTAFTTTPGKATVCASGGGGGGSAAGGSSTSDSSASTPSAAGSTTESSGDTPNQGAPATSTGDSSASTPSSGGETPSTSSTGSTGGGWGAPPSSGGGCRVRKLRY